MTPLPYRFDFGDLLPRMGGVFWIFFFDTIDHELWTMDYRLP